MLALILSSLTFRVMRGTWQTKKVMVRQKKVISKLRSWLDWAPLAAAELPPPPGLGDTDPVTPTLEVVEIWCVRYGDGILGGEGCWLKVKLCGKTRARR